MLMATLLANLLENMFTGKIKKIGQSLLLT